MKLNPQQAPLYGECLLTVQLCDEDRFEDEEDVEFYLLFSGTTQRHLTSTLRISHVTLQAICPAHDCCESVRVTLCSAKPGHPADAVAEERLQFVQDLAFDMAQFLVSTAGQDDGLEGAMLLDECQIPLRECERLDESLSLALRHLTLPQGWSVLGTNLGKDTAPAPQETLLHFAARRGLRRVAVFLLQQPGGRDALRVPDKQGAIPASVAERKGHRLLQQLLTPEEIAPQTVTVPSLKVSEGRVVRHHPRLNTYTLSVATVPGSPPPSLQGDVEELRQLIRCHAENKGAPLSQPRTELQETGQECGDSLGTVTERAGLDRLQQDCLHIAEHRPEAEEDWQAEQPSQADPDTSQPPSEPPSEPPLGDGSVDKSALPCQNSDGDLQIREEAGAEPTRCLTLVGDCGKAPDKGDTSQGEESLDFSLPSCGERQQETDTETLISDTQGVDKEDREGERVEKQAGGNAAQTAAMGQAQSQGHREEGQKHSREAELDGEKAPEAPSTMERESGSESERAHSGTVLVRSGREDGEETQDIVAGPERPCDAAPQPTPCETELKTNSETNSERNSETNSETNQETPVMDCSGENAAGDSVENRVEALQGGQIGCGEPHSNTVSERENASDRSDCSAGSALFTEAEPSQSGSTEERLAPALVESSPVEVVSPQPDTEHPQGSAETGTSEEGPTCSVEKSAADVCQQESPSSAVHLEYRESLVTQNYITSCAQEGGSLEDGAGGGHVSLGELTPSSEEDPFLSFSSSITELSPLPKFSTVTPPTQTIHSLEEESMAEPSQIDESITHSDAASDSKGNSQDQLEEEGGAAGIDSGSESSPLSSPNEDATVVTQRVSSPGLPLEEPESDRPSRAPEGKDEQTVEGEEFEPTQETQDTALESNGSDTEPGTPSCPQEAVIHIKEPPLPETHIEKKEKEEEEENDHAFEEKGDIWSTPESSHEVPESGVAAETVVVNGGYIGLESLSKAPEQSTEDAPEEAALAPRLEAVVEESAESMDAELAAGEFIASFVDCDNSTEDDVTVLASRLETTQEEPDLWSQASPLNCDPVTPDLPGVFFPKDPIRNLNSGLERVEEECEETGECRTPSEDMSHVTDMKEEIEGLPTRDDIDGRRRSASGEGASTEEKINRETDAFYPIDPCGDPSLLEKKPIPECPESPLSPTSGRSVSTTKRDSGSDADCFFGPDVCDDAVFRKAEEPVTGDSTSEVSVSCSSTDDAASLGPPSSTPDSYAEASRRWSSEEAQQQPGGGAAVGGGEAEEEKDRLTEVPARSAILRPSGRSLSPFRRHSWGPGKNPGGEAEMNQRSSLGSPGEGKPIFHRRSMSWCPSEAPPSPDPDDISSRSYSLEGLAADRRGGKECILQGPSLRDPRRMPRQESEERGSLVSLTEEEQESDLGECSSLDSQISGGLRPPRHSGQSMTLPLTKSVSMLTISQKDLESMRSYSSASCSLGYSISEEDPGPLRSDTEGKGVTKVSRTFSYIKSKMYKKTKEKDKDRSKDKEKEAKEREKRTLNGHLFSPVVSPLPVPCYQCNKAINSKDASFCTICNTHVHKGCRETLPACAKVKMKQQKQQTVVTDSATMPPVTLRSKSTPSRERPWSAVLAPDDPALAMGPRRHTSIMAFNSSNLSKSMSISNIAGPVFDEMPLKGLRYLSQSTDSLHKTNKVNESTESLTDEGTEMMDSQLMGEFETDSKDLEADSWSFTQDKKFLKQLKKDIIKRQDVIYELIQTEMHHVRTLKIMSDVYSKGLLKEVQLEAQTVERVFPVLDDLLDLHTGFFNRLLERRREAQQEGKDGGFVIRKIGDVLLTQFSGCSAERMKKVYGKFCSRHNEAVNFYKEMHTKDKRFQAFIKRKMSSTIVRRLGIPECILLVTQRITKYPVLLQRILQHTKENEEDHWGVTEALRLVKEVIAAVDSKVNEHDKKRRLKEVYSRTDSKSIMRMKSGQMFAREDLVRGRRLLHDGPLLLKNSAGRLKEVQALLLSDIFVFLQEKDQKYVFASLDQRSTVISLQKLIVREVANEEKGLFLITAGMEKPEMVEVHASTKEERNTWMQLIQDAMQSIEKDDDEGIPSETEEDKRLVETKAKEMRELLRKKDEQIVALLEEKVKLFRDMCDCGTGEDPSPVSRTLFRATADDLPKGEPVMKDALKEVETLQSLVNGSLGGAMGQLELAGGGGVGPVCLPRRAETFGGFDSHQMSISKNGEKDEGEDSADLRRTESDSVLKKGGNANLLMLLKRNSEQVLHSVTNLHDLLNTLQAVVVQQDSFIEDQRQALSERPASRPSSRPSSLIEQEKQRSLEKQRQEAANLQRQQAAHADERRRREREWDAREQALGEREAALAAQEEEARRRRRDLEEERQELQARKEEYQRDLERLRDAQRRLERDREQVRREAERTEQSRAAEEKQMHRTPSTTSEDSLLFLSSSSLDRDAGECELSSSPRKDSLSRLDSKRKGKNFMPFGSNSSQKASSGEAHNQMPNRLMQLAKSKDKKEKKKKKGKGQPQTPESPNHPDHPVDGVYFC